MDITTIKNNMQELMEVCTIARREYKQFIDSRVMQSNERIKTYMEYIAECQECTRAIRKELEQHNIYYHNSKPIISDAEYDMYKKMYYDFIDLEEEYFRLLGIESYYTHIYKRRALKY